MRLDGGVPVCGMTISAMETLIQAFVRDGLGSAVTHRQVSASRVLLQFGFISIPVAESSLEIALPRWGRSCQSQTPRGPCVVKDGKLGEKLARSCYE